MSRAALAGMLLCVLTLVSCSSLAALSDLQSDLQTAGYEPQNINHNVVNGRNTLLINAAMPHGVPSEDDANQIAEIVWTKYPAEVDELVITINGQQLMDASAADLREQFGERPASLKAPDGGGGSNVLLIVVVLVIAALFAGLVVLLWLRGRRPPPPVAPPSYQQPPYQQYPSYQQQPSQQPPSESA